MNTYTHLSINEREKIMSMLAQGIKPSKIVNTLGRSRSTISREILRNCKLNCSGTVIFDQLYHSFGRIDFGKICTFLSISKNTT